MKKLREYLKHINPLISIVASLTFTECDDHCITPCIDMRLAKDAALVAFRDPWVLQ